MLQTTSYRVHIRIYVLNLLLIKWCRYLVLNWIIILSSLNLFPQNSCLFGYLFLHLLKFRYNCKKYIASRNRTFSSSGSTPRFSIWNYNYSVIYTFSNCLYLICINQSYQSTSHIEKDYVRSECWKSTNMKQGNFLIFKFLLFIILHRKWLQFKEVVKSTNTLFNIYL